LFTQVSRSLTGSLGLLAEAAHSALDLAASVITSFSVRIAGRPADEGHPYGHGRAENLSAVVQGVLLLGTASWIAYEALRRIFFEDVAVHASFWAFAVMAGACVSRPAV
jgi:cation diffusion facilitator family transporter